MNLFKRVTTTLTATADRTVSRFENHEAVSEAALEGARRSIAEARAVVRRHDRAAAELEAARAAAREDLDTWSRRAREHADDDDTALACLARRREAAERLRDLDARLASHAADGERLRARVGDLERRHDELARRQRALRSRASLARAEHVIGEAEPRDLRLDEVLDRWETSVDAAELRTVPAAGPTVGRGVAIDPHPLETSLGARLEREERDRALRAELAALRASVAGDGVATDGAADADAAEDRS